MKNIIIIGLKLTIICAVAASTLGFIDVITAPKIERNKEIALQEALSVINKTGTPGQEEFVTGNRNLLSYYPVILPDGEINSYILRLVGEGYGGDLIILANFEKNGTLIASALLEHQETPGLGDAAANLSYYTKFIGKGSDTPIPVRKTQLSQADADAIGGATATFVGVANALAYGSEFVKKIGE